MLKNFEEYKYKEDFLEDLFGEMESIFEMTVWVRDHANFLDWRCNYPTDKIIPIINGYLGISKYLTDSGFDENPNIIKEFRIFSIETAIKLELCNQH